MPPDPAYVEEWFRYADRDLRAAEVLVHAEDVEPVVALAQLQQALEKALKGFLLSHGWTLVRTHDLGFLLDEAVSREPGLEDHHELADIATRAYYEERYPDAGGIEVPTERAIELYEEGEALVHRLRDARG